MRRSTERGSKQRGVWVERGVNDAVEITVIARNGDVLFECRMPKRIYDPDMTARLQRLLDREDPVLRVMTSDQP